MKNDDVYVDALKKKAEGFTATEISEEYSSDGDGNLVLVKRKVNSKYYPPDTAAIKSVLDMDILETLSDEELENEKRRRENSNNYRRPWKKTEKKNEDSNTEEDNSIIPSNIKTEKMDIYTQEELEELDREEEENYDDDDDDIDYDEFDSYYDEK